MAQQLLDDDTKGNKINTYKKDANSIAINSYHVSCQSDKPVKGTNAAGIVLYQKDGKTDWYCNGVHCQTGYIIIKNTPKIEKVDISDDKHPGMVHGKVYKSVFGTPPDKNVIR